MRDQHMGNRSLVFVLIAISFFNGDEYMEYFLITHNSASAESRIKTIDIFTHGMVFRKRA